MIEVIKKPVKIETPHIDAIHGHTILEFRDVRNGKRERIEKDNVVTQGAEKLMRTLGAFANNRFTGGGTYREGFKMYSDPASVVLFGGILLFDHEVNTNSLYPSAGTKMIGNGCVGQPTSQNTPEFATYNAQESSISPSSSTFVYDWGTAQANGEIASVCLTSGIGGYVGYGNASGGVHSRYWQFDSGLANSSLFGSAPVVWNRSVMVGNNIYFVLMDSAGLVAPANASSITLYKKNFPINEIGLLTCKVDSARPTTDSEQVVINVTPVNKELRWIGYKGTKIFLAATSDASAFRTNETRVFIVADVLTGVVQQYSVTNNTGIQFSFSTYTGSNQYRPVILSDTEILISISASPYTFYKIDLSAGTFTNMEVSAKMYSRMLLSDGFILSETNPDSNNENLIYITDLVNKTCYPMNGVRITSSPQGITQSRIVDDYIINEYQRDYYSFSYSLNAFNNPLMLTTINNLDSPVTKTANLTMKVTYTLTME